MRASQTLLAIGVFVVCAAVQGLAVAMGLMQAVDLAWLSAYTLSGSAVFYALVRTGANLRLGSDPSLTMPQSLFAISSVSWSYAVTGPLRGAFVAVMLLVILFGIFSLRPAQARLLSVAGFGGLAAAMLWCTLGPTPRYPPRLELLHGLLAAIVLGATLVLVVRLGRMRARLSAQKAELTGALALNRELATRDMLTGLLNRRAMSELLAQEQPRQRRAGGPMALALLDIDHFKRINDRHGHLVGDAVLQHFAELARAELRGGDALARWGGEEFLLLLPGTPLAAAEGVLRRLRERIASADFSAIVPGLTVSFSGGVSVCSAEEVCERAIERADQALYRAKNAGRNCIELAPG
ncbi:GGDEF domain-containing protein [Aquabacterium sp. OR-4]|uniref:GGDEF domain-containing protein n=1 Tax=Aquabacterium sp. OR-4 TaxID=2978127 RepID=UPI0028CA6A53|nr:GGDEF domain-containing protein [Aquabacterium sp. OR-4]MDT7837737.1 GGDEF domain-containing protein [Aquabacterium sp. OR-4]